MLGHWILNRLLVTGTSWPIGLSQLSISSVDIDNAQFTSNIYSPSQLLEHAPFALERVCGDVARQHVASYRSGMKAQGFRQLV